MGYTSWVLHLFSTTDTPHTVTTALQSWARPITPRTETGRDMLCRDCCRPQPRRLLHVMHSWVWDPRGWWTESTQPGHSLRSGGDGGREGGGSGAILARHHIPRPAPSSHPSLEDRSSLPRLAPCAHQRERLPLGAPTLTLCTPVLPPCPGDTLLHSHTHHRLLLSPAGGGRARLPR
jgi:hypothetical protein